MSSQKERILKRLMTLCESPPTDMQSLGSFISTVEGSLCAIDKPNFDPYSTTIYKLTMDLEEIYAVKLESKSSLRKRDLRYISEVVNNIKNEITQEIEDS